MTIVYLLNWNSIRILLSVLFLLLWIYTYRLTCICVWPNEPIYLCELRVLKICSISLNLRRTINIYWDSLVKMRDLLLYIVFTMFVVSVMCLITYQGQLSQRCVPKVVGSIGKICNAIQCFLHFFFCCCCWKIVFVYGCCFSPRVVVQT